MTGKLGQGSGLARCDRRFCIPSRVVGQGLAPWSVAFVAARFKRTNSMLAQSTSSCGLAAFFWARRFQNCARAQHVGDALVGLILSSVAA